MAQQLSALAKMVEHSPCNIIQAEEPLQSIHFTI